MKKFLFLLILACPVFAVMDNKDTVQAHAVRITRTKGTQPGHARLDASGWVWSAQKDTADTVTSLLEWARIHGAPSVPSAYDSAGVAHIADTCKHEKDTIRTAYKSDTAIVSAYAIRSDTTRASHFADSSKNTHKADTALDAGKFAGKSWPLDSANDAKLFAGKSWPLDSANDAKYFAGHAWPPDTAVSVKQATQLTTARTIGGTSFNGTINIIPDTARACDTAEGAKYWAGKLWPPSQSDSTTKIKNMGTVNYLPRFSITNGGLSNSSVQTDATAAYTGMGGSTAPTNPLEVWNGANLLSNLSIQGIQGWYIQTTPGTGNGLISYGASGGYPGINIYTGTTYDQNRFCWTNNATFTYLAYAADTSIGIKIGPTGNVSIRRGTVAAPTAVTGLEVGGDIQANGGSIMANVIYKPCALTVGAMSTTTWRGYQLGLYDWGDRNSNWGGILLGGYNPGSGLGFSYSKAGLIYQSQDGWGRQKVWIALNNETTADSARLQDSVLVCDPSGIVNACLGFRSTGMATFKDSACFTKGIKAPFGDFPTSIRANVISGGQIALNLNYTSPATGAIQMNNDTTMRLTSTNYQFYLSDLGSMVTFSTTAGYSFPSRKMYINNLATANTGIVFAKATTGELGATNIAAGTIPMGSATTGLVASVITQTSNMIGVNGVAIDELNVTGGHIGVKNTLTQGGAEGNGLLLYGSVGGGSPYRSVKIVPFIPGTAIGVDYVGMKIYTSNSGTTFVNALTALPNGYVSVGGANPQHQFVISAADAGGIEFLPSGGTSGATATQIMSYDRTTPGYLALDFKASVFRFVTGSVGIGGVPTSILQVVGLPTYANNAAAVAAGLTAGAFYRSNGDPDVVCVVH
jgi:hypothetical protein